MVEDAEILIVAYGTSGRVAQTAVKLAREQGIRAGLFRPITAWPFPYDALEKAAEGKALLVVEMSAGQMLDDVRLAVQDRHRVHFLGRFGGQIPLPEDVLEAVKGIPVTPVSREVQRDE
jgi:2-oxoglutarate ferredoxin oxidoreductase subunit alpha